MDVLIIGGSRFVGPILVTKLLKRGHNVTVFNRGRIKSIYDDGVTFVKGDRNEGFGKLQNVHFDLAIDMCAYFGKQTEKAVNEIDFDLFINFGTVAAYQKTGVFPLNEENSPLGDWPLWGSYNKGKVECENFLENSGIKFATLRPVYILGPKNYVDRERFIYSKIKNSTPITIPGDGEARVQFVFSKDVAESIALLTEKKATGAFNCANDEVITLKELVEKMGRIVGLKPILKFNPNSDGEKFNEKEFPFANENIFCSTEKIKKLGVKFTPLAKGLKENYENYYKHVV